MFTVLLYFFAVIGFLVVAGAALFAASWAFCRGVARAELRRKARLAALTAVSNQ